MAQGKQAKTLTDSQIARMLREVENSRYPLRDRVMVLLSVRAGLRAKEIALATWGMVLDADGNVSDTLELHDKASKGGFNVISRSGRRFVRRPRQSLAEVSSSAADHELVFGTMACARNREMLRNRNDMTLKKLRPHSSFPSPVFHRKLSVCE
jgi:integrase